MLAAEWMEDPRIVLLRAWTKVIVESLGWTYLVVNEPPKIRLANVRFLSAYRREWLVNQDVLGEMCSCIGQFAGMTIADAERSVLEQRLVLGAKRPGMLADDLSEYLFIRSTGHIGSLMDLIRRGCAKAIRTGSESLNKKLFDSIRIDSAAEKARGELLVAFRTRRYTTELLSV
jgi:hypothetical protein